MTVPEQRDGNGPRSVVQLLELTSRRVIEYRLTLIDIARAIRPEHCMGCRIVERLLLNSDHTP